MRKLKLEELGRISNEAYKEIAKIPVVVVLDNIRSAMNVGSFFRTSDAFKLEKIILCGITARPPHKEILKTAIGATQSVDWQYHEDVVKSVKDLKTEGYQIIGIEQTSESLPLVKFEVRTELKYTLIFGNEVQGITSSLLPILDGAIEIQQFGTKHSLNVSVCGGIVLWHFASPFV